MYECFVNQYLTCLFWRFSSNLASWNASISSPLLLEKGEKTIEIYKNLNSNVKVKERTCRLLFALTICKPSFPKAQTMVSMHQNQIWWQQGFFLGGTGVPLNRQKFCQSPPSDTCPRFWTKACPPPAEVRPRKFEKFKYMFVSNLTTFKLKSTLKKLYFMLKIAKNGLILH